MWNYVKFLAHLRHKDPTEYTGSETRIASKIADGDTSWVPSFTSLVQRDHDAL